MEQNIIVLYAESFEHINDNGNKVVGVSVWYYPAADLAPRRNKQEKTYGVMPCKAVLDISKEVQLQNVPALYTARFDTVSAGSEGFKLKLAELSYIRDVWQPLPLPFDPDDLY